MRSGLSFCVWMFIGFDWGITARKDTQGIECGEKAMKMTPMVAGMGQLGGGALEHGWHWRCWECVYSTFID